LKSNSSIEDTLIIKYSQLISKKFDIDTDKATKLAIEAVSAYEAHGGCSNDYDGMMKVINVVVRSWINKENKY
jgi:hypothetical protein